MEILLLIGSLIITVFFLIRWYLFVFSSKSIGRKNTGIKSVFALLPVVCTVIIITTLKLFASFDVVDSGFYITLYTLIGLSWLYCGLILISLLFDLSWIDDALNLKNKAAMLSIAGCAIAVTLIYSGANVGDGPGWWCVYFAGGIGVLIGIFGMFLLNATTNMSERVTIERDVGFGIRLFFFFISAGIILGRASAGDWNSFAQTVLDFKDAWPLLPLLLIFILLERIYIAAAANSRDINESHIFSSVFFGIIFVALAVLSVKFVIPPVAVNPDYNSLQPVVLQLIGGGTL